MFNRALANATEPLSLVDIVNLDEIFRQEEESDASLVDGSQVERNDFELESVEASNLSINNMFI